MDRRFWERAKFIGIVKVAGENDDGNPFIRDCSVIDYCDGGIGLRSDSPITAPSPIRVIIGQDAYHGQVRYCRKSPLGYYAVGVRLPLT